jgi:hypothetical protein
MALPSVYSSKTTEETLSRLNKLSAQTQPLWGKMNASQMLAHLNVTYDLAYEKINPSVSFFNKLMMKLFVKKIIVSEKKYPQNSRTAPVFIISNERDFEKEKALYIKNINDTEKKGSIYFEGKENSSMGKLTAIEWNNMFYKHTNHHFEQFGI